MIAVFRPTRAGDADAVLRCVRLLRAVQEQRAFCPTGKGGGIDNSCSSKGGGGGGDYGNYPGNGTGYGRSLYKERLLSELKNEHQIERDNFSRDKSRDVSAQKKAHDDERKEFDREAKRREKQLAKRGDEKALEDHRAQTERDRAAMDERHAAEKQEMQNAYAARKDALESQHREDRESYKALQQSQQQEFEEFEKAGEASFAKKAAVAEAEYERTVAEHTQEINARYDEVIQEAEDDEAYDEVKQLESERKQEIADREADAAETRDEEIESIREEHDQQHEFKAANLDEKHGREQEAYLQERLNRYRREPKPLPDKDKPIDSLDQQYIDKFGLEAWKQAFGRSVGMQSRAITISDAAKAAGIDAPQTITNEPAPAPAPQKRSRRKKTGGNDNG